MEKNFAVMLETRCMEEAGNMWRKIPKWHGDLFQVALEKEINIRISSHIC